MRFYAILLLLVTIISSTLALPPCVCTRNIKFVCGSDGKTYNNQCLLECESSKHNNEITRQRDGPCEDVAELDPCTSCTLDYRPVCGSNGKDYPHKCVLDCERKTHPELTFTEGACEHKEACKVTMEYKPVCGSDGKDYPNLSSLECEKRSHPDLTYTEGTCKTKKEDCIVTLDYRPVCGSDGKDYPNGSAAECEKRSHPELTYTEGACKKD